MASMNRLKNDKRLILAYLVAFCGMVVMALSPSAVFADDFDDNALSYAPHELDQQQAIRWVNALPWARPYLARIWGIPQYVAESYGAVYRMPVCGLGLANGNFNAVDSSGNPYIRQSPDELGIRWDYNPKGSDIFIPIKIEYPQPEPSQIIVVEYNAPPMLDSTQKTRWGQSLPSSKLYLARLWDVPIEEAIKYGAK